MGDVGPLAHLAEGDDVFLAPADGAPVPARVLRSSLSDCESQRGALPAPQPLVEDDGGDLPFPCRSRLPSPSIQPRRKRTGPDSGSSASTVSPLSPEAGASSSPSASTRCTVCGTSVSQPAPMRYSAARWRSCAWPARTTLSSWGVGQQPLGHYALRQQRAVGRHGVRHRRHGAGLHQRGRMLDRPPAHGGWMPAIVRRGPGGFGRHPPAPAPGGTASYASSATGPQSWGRTCCVCVAVFARFARAGRGVGAPDRRGRRPARARWDAAPGTVPVTACSKWPASRTGWPA